MRDDLARRSHELLKAALELDESGRTAFVRDRCHGNDTLRDKVLSLLAAVTKSRDFLETPALGHTTGGKAAHEPEQTPTIPGYRIVGVIGQGGMARVYEAIQERPHRRVALKVMNRGMTQTAALRRFEFETEVLARLRHPNIAQIYEVGSVRDSSSGSVPYFAMEHIQAAQSITAYADDQALDLRARLALFASVCDAVQHGHQNGVIHRDLKPGNVLVDAAGHPKVIDFGIARSTDPDQAWITQHADMGRLLGTLNYMSPEQCAGAVDVDVRTDVYSLGMIIYELVCGRLPHDLTRVPVPEALRIVQHDQPPRPSAIRPALRGDVEAIILKAIEKDPDRRYRTAAALVADIQRHLRHQPIDARPPTLFYQARLFAQRHRTSVIALAAVALSLIVGIVLAARYAYIASRELGLRHAAETEALAQRDAAVWRAYVANIAAATAAIRFNELTYARRNLREAPELHRNWEWRFLNEATERSAATILAHDDMILGFQASRDGSQFVTGSRDGAVRLWNAANRTVITDINAHEAWVLAVALSPDGTRIASGATNDTVCVWDAATGQLMHRLVGHRSDVTSVAFGLDGVLASASADGAAMIWDANTGAKLSAIPAQPGGITGVAFTPSGDRLLTWNRRGALHVHSADGTQTLHELSFPEDIYIYLAVVSHDQKVLAAGCERGRIALWNLDSGELLHSMQTEDSVSSVRSLAFTPDDKTLASGQAREIRLWSVESGEEDLLRFRGHEEAVSGLVFTPDGFQLTSVSWDRTLRVWNYAGPDRVELVTTLRGHTEEVITTRFSPDGSMIASGSNDDTVRLWDPETGTLLGTLRNHRGAVFGLAFSPDGRRIATGAYDRTVRIWDARTGEEEFVLEGHTAALWSVAFSPDGRRLTSAGDDAVIRIWDLQTRQEIAKLPGHARRVTCVQFSPDGTKIASASRDTSVRLWDIASQTELFNWDNEHRSDVYAVVFSADGTRLFSGSRDQTVRVWNTATGERVGVLDGHGQLVTSLSINPTGDRLAAGSWFGEIVLWDLRTMEVVISFKGHEEAIRGVEFGPRGRWLASASHDHTVRIYDDAPQHERARLRRQAAANYEAAAPIVARLFERYETPKRVVEALESGAAARAEPINETLLPWLRKLILQRSLAAGE